MTDVVTDWSDPAAWYDVLNPWGPGDDFYLDLVMSAASVLDVGCGTGRLLHRARAAGHTGRLCGLDPDPGMLARARTRGDIEWWQADAASLTADCEFELATMTGHAFQCLVDDHDLRRSLRAVHAALVDGGRFAFETRHPQARAWEGWDVAFQARNPDGDVATCALSVVGIRGDVVRLTETLSGVWWDGPRVEEGSLRFLTAERLGEFLHEAGFIIEQQYGAWDRGPLTDTSTEIITVARRS